MPRPVKGHVEYRGGRWQVQATGPDGRRGWHDLPASIDEGQRELAEAVGKSFALKLKRGEFVPSAREETVTEFFARWADSRRKRYPRQVKSDEAAFRLWIEPELGPLPLRGVTRDHLFRFSHRLDTIAQKGESFGAKRARNIFSVVAAMLRDAHESRDPALRCLETNPIEHVAWPERSMTKALNQLLFPSEFLALVSCPHVPVVRARYYAVALYTTTRDGEARLFEFSHFDLRHRSVHIVKASDGAGGAKSTKSGKARRATLERELAPVIEAMLEEQRAVGRLFPDRPADVAKGNQWRPATTDYIPRPDGAYGVASTLKRDLRAALEWAGIAVRPELFDDTDTTKSQSIRFHDLRASGITWRHARGDNPEQIRQECGHEDQATNQIYIRSLRDLAPGSLFPALPARLLGNRPGKAQTPKGDAVFQPEIVGAEGFEATSPEAESTQNAVEVHEETPTSRPLADAGGGTAPSPPADPDRALKDAIHAAVDAGLYDRARALLDVLSNTTTPAEVVDLRDRRKR